MCMHFINFLSIHTQQAGTHYVGADTIYVHRIEEKYIHMSMGVTGFYSGMLTCSSDSSPDTATIHMVPGIATYMYVELAMYLVYSYYIFHFM